MGEIPELKPKDHKHMNEIRAVDRVVEGGMTDMMAIANKAVERVVPAAIATGRRPK